MTIHFDSIFPIPHVASKRFLPTDKDPQLERRRTREVVQDSPTCVQQPLDPSTIPSLDRPRIFYEDKENNIRILTNGKIVSTHPDTEGQVIIVDTKGIQQTNNILCAISKHPHPEKLNLNFKKNVLIHVTEKGTLRLSLCHSGPLGSGSGISRPRADISELVQEGNIAAVRSFVQTKVNVRTGPSHVEKLVELYTLALTDHFNEDVPAGDKKAISELLLSKFIFLHENDPAIPIINRLGFPLTPKIQTNYNSFQNLSTVLVEHGTTEAIQQALDAGLDASYLEESLFLSGNNEKFQALSGISELMKWYFAQQTDEEKQLMLYVKAFASDKDSADLLLTDVPDVAVFKQKALKWALTTPLTDIGKIGQLVRSLRGEGFDIDIPSLSIDELQKVLMNCMHFPRLLGNHPVVAEDHVPKEIFDRVLEDSRLTTADIIDALQIGVTTAKYLHTLSHGATYMGLTGKRAEDFVQTQEQLIETSQSSIQAEEQISGVEKVGMALAFGGHPTQMIGSASQASNTAIEIAQNQITAAHSAQLLHQASLRTDGFDTEFMTKVEILVRRLKTQSVTGHPRGFYTFTEDGRGNRMDLDERGQQLLILFYKEGVLHKTFLSTLQEQLASEITYLPYADPSLINEAFQCDLIPAPVMDRLNALRLENDLQEDRTGVSAPYDEEKRESLKALVRHYRALVSSKDLEGLRHLGIPEDYFPQIGD